MQTPARRLAILFSQIEPYKERPGDIAGLHGYCDEIETRRADSSAHESAGEGSGWVFQKGKFKGQILAKVAATSRGYGSTSGWTSEMLRLDDRATRIGGSSRRRWDRPRGLVVPPGANGLTGPAYVRWKAAQRWKRAVARLEESIPAPDVSGLGPCGACGTTDIATHGWLGDPITGTCVPCDAAREKRVATLHAVRDPDAARVVTAVPDTHKRERQGFSEEVVEA